MHGALETCPWSGLQWKGLQRGCFNTDRAGCGLITLAAQFLGRTIVSEMATPRPQVGPPWAMQ